MIIIHTMTENVLARLVTPSLEHRLRVMPAVVVSGARQAGKSTLAQEVDAGPSSVRKPWTISTPWMRRGAIPSCCWAATSL